MKPRIHYLILLSYLIVVLPLIAEPSYSQSLTAITERDIHAMLTAADKAARKKNVAGVLALMAPECKIKMTVVDPKSNKEVVATITKEEFAHNARLLMRRTISYNLERKNIRIKIYDATTATITSELYEMWKFRQGTLRSSSTDVLYISLRDGKLVITSNEMRTRFY
ncbi:MAG TPA: hypothetical protein VJM50_13520 [Pyrinomonadaceae bacterium]|nr:hypothetical protein [Pyrinomonadaceae bacterium]